MTTRQQSLVRRWAALLAVSLGVFAITFDGSMMPVAIGSIVSAFGVEVGMVQAAMALHSLVMASTYLAAGKLADRVGEKRIFVTGALIFAGGTLVAAMSPSVWILLLGWSCIKPVGGAMMIPAASTLIVLNYRGQQRATAFAMFSAFVAAAAVLGPLWMGLIAGALSWRVAFVSESLLIALVLLFAAVVREQPGKREARFDGVGALLTFTGLGLVVLGATLAGEFGWWQARRPFMVGDADLSPLGLSAATVFMLAGVVVLMAFAMWSSLQTRRGRTPLFQLRLFRKRVFSLGVALGFLFQLTVGGLLFVLPVFLQSALQLGPLDTSLVLLPYTLGIFVFALGTSRLPPRIPAVRIVQVGLLLMVIGAVWVRATASLDLDWTSLVPALFVFGAGAGMALSRLSVVTLAPMVADELGEASGGDATGRELGVAFGVSVLGSIFLAMTYGGVVHSYDAYHGLPQTTPEERQQAIVELEDWASKLTQDDWEAYLDSLPPVLSSAYESIVAGAYLASYQATLTILVVVVILMFALSWYIAVPSATDRPRDSSA
ncbi:MAG: hypothetical protein AMS22_00015 [Thiotrichales bacterium SG8_50]|nr:MAG: hypothetical protein AMS22_00015 [Thiotrichales bacterium SG8_50]